MKFPNRLLQAALAGGGLPDAQQLGSSLSLQDCRKVFVTENDSNMSGQLLPAPNMLGMNRPLIESEDLIDPQLRGSQDLSSLIDDAILSGSLDHLQLVDNWSNMFNGFGKDKGMQFARHDYLEALEVGVLMACKSKLEALTGGLDATASAPNAGVSADTQSAAGGAAPDLSSAGADTQSAAGGAAPDLSGADTQSAVPDLSSAGADTQSAVGDAAPDLSSSAGLAGLASKEWNNLRGSQLSGLDDDDDKPSHPWLPVIPLGRGPDRQSLLDVIGQIRLSPDMESKLVEMDENFRQSG